MLAEGSTSNFTVPTSGLTITTQTAEQYLYPIDFKFYDTSLENTYFNTGCLVPGFYEVCIQMIDSENPTTGDGQPNILGNICYSFEIQLTTPLLLVTPFDEASLDTPLPLFSWTPVLSTLTDAYLPAPDRGMFGFQSPFEAFRSNPIFYEEKGLLANVMLYPIAARPFDDCRNYAWRVHVTNSSGKYISSSEIWTFKSSCGLQEEVSEEENNDEEGDLVSKPYLALNQKEEGAYTPIADYELRFLFDNNYDSYESVDYAIVDGKGETISANVIPKSENTDQLETDVNSTVVKTGENRFLLNLEELGLKEKGLYTLMVNSISKPII